MPVQFKLASASVSHDFNNKSDIVALLGDGPRQLIADYEINNIKYKVIIDTGASISILPEHGRILSSIPRSAIKQANLNVILADEGTKHIDKKANIYIKPFGSKQRYTSVCFYINTNTNKILGYDALIGLNVLKLFDLDISFRDKRALIYHEGKLIGSEIRTQNNYQAYVQVDERLCSISISDNLSRVLNRYKSVFSDISEEPLRGKPMRIYTFHMRPIAAKARHYNPDEIIQMKNHVKDLESKGIIESAESGYSATSRIIPKKNGTGRLVINYIPLNRVTFADAYTTPHISDIFTILQGNKYFTAMDCTSGFYQILIDERDRHKTAFSTPVGHYQFIRCPFGAKNSGAYFQSEMNRIFFDGLFTRCVIYVDDILIFGKSKEEHDDNLEWVLRRCMDSNVKIKYEKCQFAKTEIDYVGFTVSGKSIRPVKDKVDSMILIHPPRDKTELKSVLGKLNFYARFIKDYSKHLEPIRELLCSNRDFQWKDYHQKSYDLILNSLKNAERHLLVDRKEDKIIELHAIGDSLEAILTKNDGKLIHRTGRLLNGAESDYSAIEKHLTALVMAMDKFKIWLDADHFKVITPIKGLDKIFKLIHRPERIDNLLLKLPLGFDKYEFETRGVIETDLNRPKTKLNHIAQEVYFVDGACKRNGKADCLATWAVCALYNKDLALRGFVDKDASSNTAEITGAIRACEYAKRHGQSEITIVTDSNNLHQAATKLIDKWQNNDWLDHRKKPVINSELFQQLLKVKDGLIIDWIKVKGHSGCDGNERADNLARSLLEETQTELCAAISNQFRIQQDGEIDELKKRIVAGETDDYIIQDGIVYYVDPKQPDECNLRTFVPESQRENLLWLAHDDIIYGGHLGVKKTFGKLNRYWWPQMHKNVEDYVKTCLKCQQFKTNTRSNPGLLHSIPVSCLFEHLHIDLMGKYLATSRGNTFIITATDAFSKYAFAEPVSSTTTQDLIDFVETRIIAVFGAPQKIITDRGAQFTSAEWTKFIEKYCIEHRMTAAYHPQANGIDERVNGTISRILRNYVNESHSDWDVNLKWATYVYNTTIHESTKQKPFQVLYGYDPRSPLTAEFGNACTTNQLNRIRESIRISAAEWNRKAQEEQQKYYNRNHQKSELEIGDPVYIKTQVIPTNRIRKFYPKWDDISYVIGLHGDHDEPKSIKVRSISTGKVSTVAISNARKLYDRESPFDQGSKIACRDIISSFSELAYLEKGSEAFDRVAREQQSSQINDTAIFIDNDAQRHIRQTEQNTQTNQRNNVTTHIPIESTLSHLDHNDTPDSLDLISRQQNEPVSSTPRRVTINEFVDRRFYTPTDVETIDSVTIEYSNSDGNNLARPLSVNVDHQRSNEVSEEADSHAITVENEQQMEPSVSNRAYLEPLFIDTNAKDPTFVCKIPTLISSTRVLRSQTKQMNANLSMNHGENTDQNFIVQRNLNVDSNRDDDLTNESTQSNDQNTSMDISSYTGSYKSTEGVTRSEEISSDTTENVNFSSNRLADDGTEYYDSNRTFDKAISTGKSQSNQTNNSDPNATFVVKRN